MSVNMENPFENYQPPTPDIELILSDTGKTEIASYKLAVLAESAQRQMLEDDDNVDGFLNGLGELNIDYDCRALEPYIKFAHPYFELQVLKQAVLAGVSAALAEKGARGFEERLDTVYGFHKDNPRMAKIVVRYSSEEED